MRAELLADDVVVPLGVARRTVDDVDEDPRPLDVAQERVAESGAAAGALDQAGDVGDRRPPLVLVAEVHDAEVRLERRERVVGDLGRRRGDRREDRRLARVRQPDQPDVGDQPQLEAEPASAPGSPFWACFGAWWVEVLKWVLPRPPRPPRATIALWPTATRSASSSPVSSS